MLDIEFTGPHRYDAVRDAVALPLRLDGEDLCFHVSADALRRKFGAGPDADLEKVFDENRLQIELIATLHVRQGQRDGTVLTADDF